jgi:CheY-like chemotaxis protein
VWAVTGPKLERDGAAPTILVVEDALQVREVARRILQGGGYEVVTVESPPDALTILSENPNIDLLLTDVVMPQMSGRQLAEQARVLHPGLPVLFMSGYPQGLLERGEVDEKLQLLEKPFHAKELLRRVSEVMRSAPKV